MDLQVDKVYRLAYNMDNPELRGKPVVLKRLADHNAPVGGYASRALVHLLNKDGSLGQAYAVYEYFIIKL